MARRVTVDIEDFGEVILSQSVDNPACLRLRLQDVDGDDMFFDFAPEEWYAIVGIADDLLEDLDY